MSRAFRIAGLAAAVVLVAPPLAQAITADEIIAHHLEALGGQERLAAIKSLKRSGRLFVPGSSIELRYTEIVSRPGSIRRELTLQGMTQIAAFDGHDGWRVEPFGGRKDPALIAADEAKSLKLGADLERPLIGYRAKGHQVEYLGLEDLDGTPAYKLRVQLGWGDQVTYWIDPDSWMLVRARARQIIRGSERVVDTDFGEYERVAGVWIAMAEESGPENSDAAQHRRILYEKAEANVPTPASLFAFPTATPTAEAHR